MTCAALCNFNVCFHVEANNLRSQPLLEDVDVNSQTGKIVLKPQYYWDISASYIACYVRNDSGIPLPPLCTQGNQSAVVLSGLDVGGTYEIEVTAVSTAGATGGTAKALVVVRGKHNNISTALGLSNHV